MEDLQQLKLGITGNKLKSIADKFADNLIDVEHKIVNIPTVLASQNVAKDIEEKRKTLTC